VIGVPGFEKDRLGHQVHPTPDKAFLFLPPVPTPPLTDAGGHAAQAWSHFSSNVFSLVDVAHTGSLAVGGEKELFLFRLGGALPRDPPKKHLPFPSRGIRRLVGVSRRFPVFGRRCLLASAPVPSSLPSPFRSQGTPEL